MLVVQRCDTPPAVPAKVTRCSFCQEACWISKHSGKSSLALAALTGDARIICNVCFDEVFGSGTQ